MRLFTYKTLTCKCECLPYNNLHLVSTLDAATASFRFLLPHFIAPYWWRKFTLPYSPYEMVICSTIIAHLQAIIGKEVQKNCWSSHLSCKGCLSPSNRTNPNTIRYMKVVNCDMRPLLLLTGALRTLKEKSAAFASQKIERLHHRAFCKTQPLSKSPLPHILPLSGYDKYYVL